MSISPNPLSGIIETKKFPFARVIRTSFLQKEKDTWDVIFGNDEHVGLAYFLGSKRLDKAFDSLEANIVKQPFLLALVYAVLLICVGVAKLVLNLIGTAVFVAASPIVFVVDLISKLFNQNKSALKDIPTKAHYREYVGQEQRLIWDRSPILMGESLCRAQLTLDDLQVKEIKIIDSLESSDPKMTVSFSLKKDSNWETKVCKESFVLTTEPTTYSHLLPFFRTNLGGINDKYEAEKMVNNTSIHHPL